MQRKMRKRRTNPFEQDDRAKDCSAWLGSAVFTVIN